MKLAQEDDNLITYEEEIPIKLSDFFWNAVTNFKSPKFENFDILSKNIDHSSLKAIVKYRKHSSIIAIASEFATEGFFFNAITIEYAFKEISMLDSSKSCRLLTYQ